MEYITKHQYHPVSLDDYLEQKNDKTQQYKKNVVFTIDDGFQQHYELALSLFQKYDTPITCFLVTDFIDKKLWLWDDQLRYILYHTHKNNINIELPNEETVTLPIFDTSAYKQLTFLREKLKTMTQTDVYNWLNKLYIAAEIDPPSDIPENYTPMSWEQAQKLIDLGHAIAPHSKTHRILSKLDKADSENEIIGSYQRTQEMLKGVSNVFAYPTGAINDYQQKDIEILKNSKITHAVTTLPKHDSTISSAYEIPRFSLPDNKLDFIQYLSFFEELKSRFRAN